MVRIHSFSHSEGTYPVLISITVEFDGTVYHEKYETLDRDLISKFEFLKTKSHGKAYNFLKNNAKLISSEKEEKVKDSNEIKNIVISPEINELSITLKTEYPFEIKEEKFIVRDKDLINKIMKYYRTNDIKHLALLAMRIKTIGEKVKTSSLLTERDLFFLRKF